MTGVAGLLLAAGEGRRFGGPKALVELEGSTLVERGVRMLQAAGCSPVVVVLGAQAEVVRPLVHAEVVVADDWAEGLGASLGAGLSALTTTPAGSCVVALVDQPGVGVEAVRRLVAAVGTAEAAVATYDGEPRNPVLLTRRVWPEVAALAVGDVGARAWLRAHPERVVQVPCDDIGSADDIDTVDDLLRLTPTESVRATRVIDAPVELVFAVLADPARHAAIDGTGWVSQHLDSEPLTAVGQVFRMAMYHPDHPDGDYQIANLVEVLDPPHAIAWKPGYDSGDGTLSFGGWVWRYDLVPRGSGQTEVTLSYDWSAVPDSIREYLSFPPFPADHLSNSLDHLAELAAG